MEPILNDPSSGNGATQSEASVKDVSEATFVADVIEASGKTPVIVDFWAPWCEPCKQLTPLLEKFTAQTKGAVRLGKVNVDENPAISQQLRIQSVPTVCVFFQGQPVDGFTGALPESGLKDFFDRVLKQAGKGEDGNRESLSRALEQAKAALETIANLAYANAKDGFTLPGLGKVSVRQSAPRTMVMRFGPREGETIDVPAKTKLKFTYLKAAKEAILG